MKVLNISFYLSNSGVISNCSESLISPPIFFPAVSKARVSNCNIVDLGLSIISKILFIESFYKVVETWNSRSYGG